MKEKKKTIKRKEQGITLIALVITIIVLLILAGVSIAMLTGQNGILTQAQKTKEETEHARINEEETLDDYNKKINEALGIPTPPEKDDEGYFKETSTINGGEGTAMNPTIPAGFKTIDENGAVWGDGTSAPEETSVNNGLVIEDKSGNQFVWVPVTGNYERNTNYVVTDVSEKGLYRHRIFTKWNTASNR